MADTLAGKLRGSGEAVAVVGLDTVAEMALPTLTDWSWAHEVHGQLVGAWLEKPIPTVIAEGPATPEEIEHIMRHIGPDVSVRRVLITARYETALARAIQDPTRGLSRTRNFSDGCTDGSSGRGRTLPMTSSSTPRNCPQMT